MSTESALPLLYEARLGVFLLISVAIGGGAAYLTGRAIALTWRPWWQVPVYAVLLGASVRFLHHALFAGTLISAHYLVVDTLVCFAFATLAHRVTRIRQMRAQYAFLARQRGAMPRQHRAGQPGGSPELR